MDGFAAVDFEFARQVLQRGIAALYLIAFVSTLNQFRPLLGEHGLMPAPELLAWARTSKRAGRMLRPTVFRWVRYSDRRLVALCIAGIVIAATLVLGIPQLGPPWVPMLAFLLLWGGYMSITSHRPDVLLVRLGDAAARSRLPRRVPGVGRAAARRRS